MRLNLVYAWASVLLCVQGLSARYPPEGGKGAVDVSAADLDRLEDGEFLNDTIIDFYIKCAAWGA